MFMSLWTPIHCSFLLLFCCFQEKQLRVLLFLLIAFGAFRPCKILKTGNASAYTAKHFQEFCKQYAATHIKAFHETLSVNLLWKELIDNLNII